MLRLHAASAERGQGDGSQRGRRAAARPLAAGAALQWRQRRHTLCRQAFQQAVASAGRVGTKGGCVCWAGCHAQQPAASPLHPCSGRACTHALRSLPCASCTHRGRQPTPAATHLPSSSRMSCRLPLSGVSPLPNTPCTGAGGRGGGRRDKVGRSAGLASTGGGPGLLWCRPSFASQVQPSTQAATP